MTRREQFDVSTGARVEIEIRTGSVEVVTGVPDRVVVTVAGADADGWEIVSVGDSVSIRPPSQWRTRRARVVAEVPPAADVSIRTASADAVLGGSLGRVRVRTASGDVRIDSAAELEIRTASGDVRAHAVETDVSAATMSGDVDLGEVGGRISATSSSGDLEIVRLGGDADIGTTSGDVRIPRFDGDDLSIKAVSGDVHVGLPSGIRVEPDLSTLSGRTSLPGPGPRSGSDPSSPRRTVRLRIKSVSGDIRIARA